MNWNLESEVPYLNSGIPYSSSESFMDFFEGLTYEHVNFIFSDATYAQENAHSAVNTNAYKFGYSEPGNFSYYNYCDAYMINDPALGNNEYTRQFENSSTMVDERPTAVHTEQGQSNTSSNANPAECPQSQNNPGDYQVVWQDNVDPDNMTYEELLELGEVVGTQSRGLPQELISLLPVSKFKCGFFWRKKSKDERCVICQMEYKRGDRLITLPCKHFYHASCGSRWLSINKACPICYKEVLVHVSKR